jgi:S-adenosylmethionine uptake transporter
MTPAPLKLADAGAPRALVGVGLATCGWALFSLQDAIVKWLVVTLPVSEVLLARSIVIVTLSSFFLRRADLSAASQRANLISIVSRATMILVAWLAYYRASRSLPLADLVTLYFAAPLFVIALAGWALGEVVGPWRWACALLGFGGVMIAADLVEAPNPGAAMLALFAAFCWAIGAVLARRLSQAVKTASLMVGSNLLFVIVCTPMMLFEFVTPDRFSLFLMLGLGLLGGLGQFFMFEGLRLAPASVVAPFEYSSLAWAMLWGFAVFGDIPHFHVFVGAGVILASGLLLLWVESRRRMIRSEA